MTLLLAIWRLNLKTLLSMRAAFLLRFGFVVINHSFMLVSWIFFFRVIPTVRSWAMPHLMLAYGLAWFAWGFVSFFAYGIKILPRTIEFGELDHFLLQPRPLLLMLATNSNEVFGIPDMMMALMLVSVASLSLKVYFLTVLFALVMASVALTSFTLLVSSLAFWMQDVYDWLQDTHYNVFVFATRPSSAFQGWIKNLMFTLIPVGFVTYLPVEIVRVPSLTLILSELCGVFFLVTLSLLVFARGLRRYESGNRLTVRF